MSLAWQGIGSDPLAKMGAVFLLGVTPLFGGFKGKPIGNPHISGGHLKKAHPNESGQDTMPKQKTLMGEVGSTQ